jgi:superoxide reductase
MNRRSFVRLGIVGVTSSIFIPKIVLSKASETEKISQSLEAINNPVMAGGLYYTKDSPGRWEKKAGSHSPILSKTDSGIRVLTAHPMNEGDHWIIKHVLLDSDFKFIEENIFDPEKDKAAKSEFKLTDQKGVVYALSVCNKHDTWVNVLEI